MKYITAYKKGKKALLKIKLDDGSDKWMETTDAVLNFAKKNFDENDEVNVEYTEKNGKYKASRVTSPGKASKKAPEDSTVKNVCEDCGKELKDDRYTKCYSCNKKAPKEEKTSKKTTNTTDKDELIKREAIAHATSRVMIGLQGQIDVNNCTDIFETIYNNILKLVDNE